jgi:hypothetical protein
LELNRAKDFKIARMILASIYSNDTLWHIKNFIFG